LNVLAYLHWEINQHPADAGSNSQRIELLLLKCGESARLVYRKRLTNTPVREIVSVLK
jgi:hypothetical protein